MVADLPEIEIVRDRHQEACLTFLCLGENHELLPFSFPWLETCRRWAANPRLMAYRHRETGRTVLGVWVYSPEESTRPVVMELEGFQGEPSRWWPFEIAPEIMRLRLMPHEERTRAFQARQREEEDQKEQNRRDDLEFRSDMVRDLRRKGHGQEAQNLERGATPFLGPASAPPGLLEETASSFTSMLKGL